MAFVNTDGIVVGHVGGEFKTFEDFLEMKCEESGGFEGVLDDDMSDAFESWLETVDPAQMIEWGNEAVKIKSGV